MNSAHTEAIERTHLALAEQHANALLAEVRQVYLGPEQVPELLLIAMCARGHVLLEGVPGVAKTTLAKAFAQTIHGNFRRIQFTPDLMPSDITGTYVLSHQHPGQFELHLGPVFANVVLGDEINRAPAKTQSALLEAMQEGQVTIDGDTRDLPSPFMVIATQNPVEHAGTYPLPEAQIDRFLIRVLVGYPSPTEELAILQRFNRTLPNARPILRPDDVLTLQALAEQIHVEATVMDYIVRIAQFTRTHPHVYLGASPRASLSLLHATKARALIAGRPYVTPDDVMTLADPVLSHRLVLTADAQMDGVQNGEVIQQALRQVIYHRG